MRAAAFAVALMVGLLITAPCAAQEWIEYQNNEDGSRWCSLPAEDRRHGVDHPAGLRAARTRVQRGEQGAATR